MLSPTISQKVEGWSLTLGASKLMIVLTNFPTAFPYSKDPFVGSPKPKYAEYKSD